MISRHSRATWPRVALVLAGAAALVLLLGASVTAARLIAHEQIKDGSVTGADLRNGSVTGVDVRAGSLTRRDYSGDVLGPVGPDGPPGPSGPIGPQGAPGLAGLRSVAYGTSDGFGISSGKWNIHRASCPAGSRALSGGFAAASGGAGARLLTSAPYSDGSGWHVAVLNEGTSDITGGFVWVTCART